MTVVVMAIGAMALTLRTSIQSGRVAQMREEIRAIQEAARSYRTVKETWPDGVETLVAEGFLPQGFSPTNPWGGTYSFSASAGVVEISTDVPAEVPAKSLARFGQVTTGPDGQQTVTVGAGRRGRQARTLFEQRRVEGPPQ